MPLRTHGDVKYRPATLLAGAAELDGLRVEHRRIGPGRQNCVRPDCTELVHVLSGRARVRRTGDGETQEGMALPGTSWLVPAGTEETLLELDGATECLIVFLPAKLLADSALRDHDRDPATARLAYAGALADPTLAQIAGALRGLIGREAGTIDRIFAGGLKTALAAHLVATYPVEGWRAPAQRPTLDPRRLRRVLDLIEARLGDPLTLADLAREACLSPYHFSRLFREATGWPPHRYLVERRIEAAQAMLRDGRASLAEVALDAGFGSQANFARTFRAVTGLTPGQYREMHRGTGSPASSQGAGRSSPQRTATSARNFASSRNTAPAAAP
jgi:AraC family transcriptional regulator